MGDFDKDALRRVIDDVIAPQAVAIDKTGAFPRAGIDALAEAGVLAITVPGKYGGADCGLGEATDVVRQIGAACGSTAMIVAMHYSGTAALIAADHEVSLREIGAGKHLTTLAFSEYGSRSHFWSPVSTATADGDDVLLNARKSWVTSARDATSYVWSSRPLAGTGPMSMWFVRADAPGLSIPSEFEGLGLRGNGSTPVTAEDVRVPRSAMLCDDGQGLDFALAVVLPWFLLLNAASSVGLMQGVITEAAKHLTKTQLQHLGQSLAQQVPSRARLARMQIQTDMVRASLAQTVAAIGEQRADAPLMVLEIKAAAADAAVAVTDLAMQACGGSAFRKELGVERRFRDSLAARVMAPTTDALHDFIGRSLCGLPLFDEVKS